jgi:alpha-tubulin suppressor-like RCC1 family protein
MKTFQKTYVALLFITITTTLWANLPPGELVSWGDYAPTTAPLKSVTNATAVSGGFSHGLALLNDGTVFGWGSNMAGQIASALSDKTNGLITFDGQILSNIVAVSAGARHSLALKADGHVVAWGDNSVGQTTTATVLSNVISIAAGFDHSLALRKDGTVVGWGMTKTSVELSNIVAVAASSGWGGGNMALKQDGTVIEWRGGMSGEVEGLSNVVEIAAGANHRLALRKDGTVYGWGRNADGAATGTPTSPLYSNGLVTINGQLLTNVVAIAANGTQFDGISLALKSDGTVVFWGHSPYHRMDVPEGLSNVVAIAAGQTFCLAITTNRAVAEKLRH